MRLYTYYMKPGETAPEDAVAVREGFSWAAFLLTFLWAFYHRLWVVGLVLLAVPALVQYAIDSHWLHPAAGSALILAFTIFVGCTANDWRREKMERQGWVLSGIAAGGDLVEADRRFFDKLAHAVPPPSAARLWRTGFRA
ncbi:MAG TPA: DUF2628 domain-containing protein [Alphaproteobacteria bacterium]